MMFLIDWLLNKLNKPIDVDAELKKLDDDKGASDGLFFLLAINCARMLLKFTSSQNMEGKTNDILFD